MGRNRIHLGLWDIENATVPSYELPQDFLPALHNFVTSFGFNGDELLLDCYAVFRAESMKCKEVCVEQLKKFLNHVKMHRMQGWDRGRLVQAGVIMTELESTMQAQVKACRDDVERIENNEFLPFNLGYQETALAKLKEVISVYEGKMKDEMSRLASIGLASRDSCCCVPSNQRRPSVEI